MGYTYLTQIILTYLYWKTLSIDVPIDILLSNILFLKFQRLFFSNPNDKKVDYLWNAFVLQGLFTKNLGRKSRFYIQLV